MLARASGHAGGVGSPCLAWSDYTDPFGGPDIYARSFSSSLVANDSQDVALATTADAESDVVLAPFAGGWAAAWRTDNADVDAGGLESVVVRTSSGDGWTVGPLMPGAAGERPALVPLDSQRLLVAFTSGTDPTDAGVSNVPRLRGAVLDVAVPGATSYFDLPPQAEPWASTPEIGQHEPVAVVADGFAYVAWRTDTIPGDPLAEEVWLARLEWSVDAVTGEVVLVQHAEIPLVAADALRAGDQRVPALASAWEASGPALLTAWQDHGRTFGGGEGTPDVGVVVVPVPRVRLEPRSFQN